MQQFQVVLQPGIPLPLEVKGIFFRVIKSSSAIKVRFDGGQEGVLSAGMGVTANDGQGFSRLLLTSELEIPQTVELVVSDWLVSDNRIFGELQTKITSYSGTTGIDNGAVSVDPGPAATQLIVANEDRRNILFTPTNGDIWIGGAGVTVDNGLPVKKGGSLTLETSAALYAVGSMVGVDVRYIEEINSEV